MDSTIPVACYTVAAFSSTTTTARVFRILDAAIDSERQCCREWGKHSPSGCMGPGTAASQRGAQQHSSSHHPVCGRGCTTICTGRWQRSQDDRCFPLRGPCEAAAGAGFEDHGLPDKLGQHCTVLDMAIRREHVIALAARSPCHSPEASLTGPQWHLLSSCL